MWATAMGPFQFRSQAMGSHSLGSNPISNAKEFDDFGLTTLHPSVKCGRNYAYIVGNEMCLLMLNDTEKNVTYDNC